MSAAEDISSLALFYRGILCLLWTVHLRLIFPERSWMVLSYLSPVLGKADSEQYIAASFCLLHQQSPSRLCHMIAMAVSTGDSKTRSSCTGACHPIHL